MTMGGGMSSGGGGGGMSSGGGGGMSSGGGGGGGMSSGGGGGGGGGMSSGGGGGGGMSSGGGGGMSSPAAVNFATQYVKTQAATGMSSGGGGMSSSGGMSSGGGGGMSSGGGGMSAPTSIQQVFGGGKLTNKEFTQAKQQFGGKAVKDYIRGNATAGQVGGKLADRLGGLNSMQQFFGKAPGATPGTTPQQPQTPESTPDPEPQGQPEPEAYDFSAAMEEQLAPLRQQIQDLLSKQQETKPTTGGGITDGSSGGLSKPGYSYNPSGNTVGYPQGGSDTSPDLFKSWMSNQESLNRSSTAYMFSPGGTRRSDEADGAASATSAGGSNDWNKFWDPADGDAIDREWQASDSDTSAADAEERLKRSRSGQRMAGSIFDGVSPTGSSSSMS